MTSRWRLAIVVVGLGSVAAVAGLLTPLGDAVAVLVRFVADAYPTNNIVNSHPWAYSAQSRPLNASSAAGLFAWEVLRFGWVGVAIAAGVVLWRELARPADQRRRSLICLCLLVGPTLVLSSGWTVCQIIPGVLGRTGSLTAVAGLYVLPVLLLSGREGFAAAATAAGLAVLVGAVNGVELNTRVFNLPFTWAAGFTQPQWEVLVKKPFALNVPAPGLPLVDGKDLGLPRLGRGYCVDGNALSELIELKQVLSEFLRPGETFFDLANKTALYYYLDLPIPVRYAASHTAVNRATQSQVLRDLARSRPPVVLLETQPHWEVSLMSSYLVQDCLLRYAAVQRGRFALLVDPERVPHAGPPGCREQLAVLDAPFRIDDIGATAAAWGRSWHRLAGQFEEIQTLHSERQTETTDRAISYRLSDLALRGRDANFLWVRFAAERPPGGPDPVLEVRWSGQPTDGPADPPSLSPGTSTASAGALRLVASGPVLLIPLGIHPRWLLAERIDTLRLVLRNPESCRSFAFPEVKLLRLPPP